MAVAPIVAAASVVAAGVSVVKTLTAKPPKAPATPEVPAAPAPPTAAQTTAAKRRNQTLLFADEGSRPSTMIAGNLGSANTGRSTLLGM